MTSTWSKTVPPYQCPECGRFLKNGLVASLGGTSHVACPGCDTTLTAAMFDETPPAPAESNAAPADNGAGQFVAGDSAAGDGAAGDSAADDGAAGDGAGDVSVPAAIASTAHEVLEGWDTDGTYDADRDDLPPFPQDAIIVGGAAAAGALLGALLSDRRARGAFLGAIAGAAGAGAARQVWRLNPDEPPSTS